VRRREFITLLGSAAATLSFPVPPQKPERIRRIGILLPVAADDAGFQTWIAAFYQAIALLGWNVGRNLRVDTRWATSNAADIRRHASELAASAPDVILAHGAATLAPLLQVTRTVPTVFVVVTDPVGAGLVESLPTPVSAVGKRNFPGQRQRPRNGPRNSMGRLQRQNACTNRRQFGAIRTEPGNLRLRRTAWWGWEDSNF
jgi:ABC-type uncharacterized transport system substrate-binding protein